MIKIHLSETSVAAAQELDKLLERGELFSEDGYLRSTPSVDTASRSFINTVKRDLLREVGGQSDGQASLHLLNPEKPSDARRYHRNRHGISCFFKIEVGNGYCAYGRYEGGACWYDGIARC